MTIALLAKFGPWLLGVLGIVFGLFKHQEAKTAKAETETAKQQADNATAVAASKTVALDRVTDAGKERASVDAGVAKLRSDELDKALKDEGFVG